MATYYLTPEQYEKFYGEVNPGADMGRLPKYAIMNDLMVHKDKTGVYGLEYITPMEGLKGGVAGIGFSTLQREATGSAKQYFDEWGRTKYYVLETNDPELERAAKAVGGVKADVKGGRSKSQLDDMFNGKVIMLPEKEMTAEEKKIFERAKPFDRIAPEKKPEAKGAPRKEEEIDKGLYKQEPSAGWMYKEPSAGFGKSKVEAWPFFKPGEPFGVIPKEKMDGIYIVWEEKAKNATGAEKKKIENFLREISNLKKIEYSTEFGGKAKQFAYVVPNELLNQVRVEMYSQEFGANLKGQKGKAKQ